MTLYVASASEIATLSNQFEIIVNGVAQPTDPTTVTLAITDPEGTVTTYTGAQITKVSTGIYTKDVACSIPGVWQYVWTGTGTVNDTEDGTWTVQELSLGHLYVTPHMIRSRVGLSATDTTNDLELYGSCYAASRAIEQYCERTFWRTLNTEARSFAPDSAFELDLGPFNDLVSVTSLKTDNDGDGTFETTWQTTEYELCPQNVSNSETRPFTSVHAVNRLFPYIPIGRLYRVQITGVFGWPVVPAPVREAARILGSELFKAKDAPFGVANFGEYGAIRIRENPLVERMLQGYRHFNGYAV